MLGFFVEEVYLYPLEVGAATFGVEEDDFFRSPVDEDAVVLLLLLDFFFLLPPLDPPDGPKRASRLAAAFCL